MIPSTSYEIDSRVVGDKLEHVRVIAHHNLIKQRM